MNKAKQAGEAESKPKRSSAAVKVAAWKTDKIRAALSRYRAVHATGKNPLPLSEVMLRIAHCPVVDPVMLKDQHTLIYPEEWLRRFTHGVAGRRADRVDTVSAFLIVEDFLAGEQLSDDQQQAEMLAVHGFLGSGVATGGAALRKLLASAPVATFSCVEPKIDRITKLRLEADTASTLLYAEENLHDPRVRRTVRDRRLGQYQAGGRTRKGYAILSTRTNILLVVLQGGAPGDRIICVQIDPLDDPLWLARHGEPELPTIDHNLKRFVRDANDAAAGDTHS